MNTGKWQKKKPPTDFEKEVGKRIRDCREKMSLSTETLAKALGVSSSAITQYELGIRSPSLDRLASLAAELKVSADYLLGTNLAGSDVGEEMEQFNMAYKALSSRDRELVAEIITVFLRARPGDSATVANARNIKPDRS